MRPLNLFSRVARAMTIVAMGAAPADAQSPTPAEIAELVTDRPDFTESSQVMGKGWFQFESGVTYEGTGPDFRSITVPSALMRIGIGRRTEVRVGADGLLSESLAGVRASGHSDIELGAKTGLLRQETHGIDLSLLPMVSLPVGAARFSSGGIDPTLKITWGLDIPAGFGVTGNLNASSLSGERGRFHQEAASVSLGHGIGRGWGGYAEVYGFSRLERGEASAWTLNGGVTRALGTHRQFDLEIGRGVTAAAPNWFVAAGFAIRGAFGEH